jgi:hypothetical protein
MIPGTVKNVRKALVHLNPSGVRAEAERVVTIGLTAGQPAHYGAMESFLAPPDLPVRVRLRALRHVFHTDTPGAPPDFDVEIQDESLPPCRGVYDFRFDAPAETVQRILRDREDLELPLARLFPPFREEACRRIVRRISKENAVFAMAMALPNVVPSFVSLPWAAGEFASDTAILTANQIRMAFLLAAAGGRDVGYAAQKAEIGSIVAGAFGWRALAREIVGKVPAGAGLIPKAAIAYAGTFVVGKSIVRLHRAGRSLSRRERKDTYQAAYAQGCNVAAQMVEGLKPAVGRAATDQG